MHSWSQIDGSVYDNEELSKEARMTPHLLMALEDAVEPSDDLIIGKNSGESVGFRLYGRIDLSSADVALQETERVPSGSIPTFHGTGTVYRRAFAVPYTGTREDLDRLDTQAPIIKALSDHAARVKNKVIRTRAVAGRSFCYVASGASAFDFATNGSPGAQAASQFNIYHARKLKLKMTQYNVPTFDGQNYLVVAPPLFEDGITSETGADSWTEVVKYAPGGAEGALRGEIGKLQRQRFAIDNHILLENIGAGSAYPEALVFGEDAIRELMVYPVHFRVNMNVGDDFGNLKAIAWQSFQDYVVPWNYTLHEDGRICHYTST